MKMPDPVQHLVHPEVRNLRRLLCLCIVVGLVAGLGAATFYVMLDAGSAFCMGYLANYHPMGPGNEQPVFEFGTLHEGPSILRWLLLILPMAGGLVSGVIIFSLAPEAEGHGTDAAIEAYHFKDGAVRTRVPLVKAITAMITIGTGGSGGREGPIAQIGSGFGSILGRWMRLPPDERRILMAAGMSAGIGAIFHAPLAGTLFAAEVLYREPDMEHEVIVPAFTTSIIAYSTFGVIFGFHPLFDTPAYGFSDPRILFPYLLLAVVVALGAMLFVRAFYGVRKIMFKHLPIPNHFKPAIGGIFVGVIGFFIPEALGAGYGIVQACFNSDEHVLPDIMSLPSAQALQDFMPDGLGYVSVAALLLAIIALAKIGTTAFAIGSGGSGGVFGPAVVIGGALGGAMGIVCREVFPGVDVQPGAFALVGMAGFFAGAANTPVSTIIMVSEMTGNYNLLVPSMLVCMVSYILCKRYTLYEKQLPSRLDAPSKLGNMASAILRRLLVERAIGKRADADLSIVHEDMTFHQLAKVFTASTQACFPVVDKNEKLTGVIDSREIRRIVTEPFVADLIIAGDIAVPAATVTASDSLLAATNTMVKADSNEIVVVDEKDPRRVVGTLSRNDIIAAYNRQIVESPR
ncbi:MAG: chloride channel protein [Phycisphaerae bacterium]|nr:chloride channel protein [Phycisphaerae bacterium]